MPEHNKLKLGNYSKFVKVLADKKKEDLAKEDLRARTNEFRNGIKKRKSPNVYVSLLKKLVIQEKSHIDGETYLFNGAKEDFYGRIEIYEPFNVELLGKTNKFVTYCTKIKGKSIKYLYYSLFIVRTRDNKWDLYDEISGMKIVSNASSPTNAVGALCNKRKEKLDDKLIEAEEVHAFPELNENELKEHLAREIKDRAKLKRLLNDARKDLLGHALGKSSINKDLREV